MCRGLQDELFNLTLDLVKVEAERTRAEAKLDGSIQRVQLDNQMLVCNPCPCVCSCILPGKQACHSFLGHLHQAGMWVCSSSAARQEEWVVLRESLPKADM